MTEELTLNMFDWAQAQREATAAIERVEMSTSAWWMNRAMDAITSCANSGQAFTTDDVWKILGACPGVEGRAMGAAMRKAERAGLIRATGIWRNSAQVSCHGRPKMTWVKA